MTRIYHYAVCALLTASAGTAVQAFVPRSNPAFQRRSTLQAVAMGIAPTPSSSTTTTTTTTTTHTHTFTSQPDSASTTQVRFPPPLSPVDRFKRAATFWASSVPVVAEYYRLMGNIKLQEILRGKNLSDDDLEERWHAQHADGAAKMKNTINNLKGFYVKAAQIVAARADLFPPEYTEALMAFQENVDPMPTGLAKAVVEKELLDQGQRFQDVFAEFDAEPLGSASVAQVHRAVLTEQYGGKEVAVKIQRPSIESKLMGDIKNLLAIAKVLRNNPNLPLDYYTVFSELEKQLALEFDFEKEASSMDRIYNSLITAPNGTPRQLPLVMPRPVDGLITKRVLVMDYLKGQGLNEAMKKRKIDPSSPEAKLFANKLLGALTTVFGRNILEAGFFHADPHPGNIVVLEDGRIGLIDFGQVKEITPEYRETLNEMMIALDDRRNKPDEDRDEDNKRVGELTTKLGIELKDSAPVIAATAMGIWLFDGSSDLPGGYDNSELSDNSPSKVLKTFPQELVLVARSSMLIKGFANRMGVSWSLAKEWAPVSRQQILGETGSVNDAPEKGFVGRKLHSIRQWTKNRAVSIMQKTPAPIRRRLASIALKLQ